MSEPRWEDLSDTARIMLGKATQLLVGGFSGRIELKCSEGGVMYMSVTHTYQPRDLLPDARSP